MAAMDFDFTHVQTPFRMQPGLRRLDGNGAQLTPLAPSHPLYAEKLRVVQAGQCFHSLPGFDPQPALHAISEAGRAHGLPVSLRASCDLPLAFEEDFAVLDGATGRLAWLCVCTPSHWSPEEKLGLDFAAVHAPVADDGLLQSAAAHLVQLATGGDRWERFVWTISPSGRYDQHPGRQPRADWPSTNDPAAFAEECFVRWERQTFLPVGQGTQQAVFTIRVMLQPLVQAVRTHDQAQRLRSSIASMTDSVLAYKNLTPARAALLRWLDNAPS
ncbi:MAG: DUF3445 domain-containing protein [Burkholderiales bacterium]|nr:MAG: DUF3445 domain-containing protein [Burkholderiales bacterium]